MWRYIETVRVHSSSEVIWDEDKHNNWKNSRRSEDHWYTVVFVDEALIRGSAASEPKQSSIVLALLQAWRIKAKQSELQLKKYFLAGEMAFAITGLSMQQ